MVNDFKRGDIILVNFGAGAGSVQGGLRPALITQNDKGNFYSPTLLVAPITTKNKPNLPTHMKIDESCGLKQPSTILFEQTQPINKNQVVGYIGHKDMDENVEIKILIANGCLLFLGESFKNVICMNNN